MSPRPACAVVATVLIVTFTAVSLTGCGGRSGAPSGHVSGKVTFEGNPVREGRVSFQNPQTGAADEAVLADDGRYDIKARLPVGEYTVIVIPAIVREKADPKGPVVGVEKAAPNIPHKYRTSGTSDLKASVREGENEINLDMKR